MKCTFWASENYKLNYIFNNVEIENDAPSHHVIFITYWSHRYFIQNCTKFRKFPLSIPSIVEMGIVLFKSFYDIV